MGRYLGKEMDLRLYLQKLVSSLLLLLTGAVAITDHS